MSWKEVYVTPTHLYVAMDLIEGGNLAVRYVFEGEEKAAHILRQIVRALRYLHDRNIAVSSNLRIVLQYTSDFSLHFTESDSKAVWDGGRGLFYWGM